MSTSFHTYTVHTNMLWAVCISNVLLMQQSSMHFLRWHHIANTAVVMRIYTGQQNKKVFKTQNIVKHAERFVERMIVGVANVQLINVKQFNKNFHLLSQRRWLKMKNATIGSFARVNISGFLYYIYFREICDNFLQRIFEKNLVCK